LYLLIIFITCFNYFLLNYLDTYEEGMQKLCLAEDTSNIDETGVSSNEVREREKKRRRIKAKKYMSSSSEDDLCSYKKIIVLHKKQTCSLFHRNNILCQMTKNY